VIVPTRNRSTLLERVLKSFAGKDSVEVVVVDDASDPEERLRNERVAEAHGVAQLIVHEQRRGGAAARGTGVLHATGSYLWFVDDDDVVPGYTVTEVVDRVRRIQPELALLASSIVDRGNTIAFYEPTPKRDCYECYRDRGQLVSLPAVIVRRTLFDDAGGWDGSMVAAQDTDLLLRLSRIAIPVCWSDVHVEVHVGHPGRVTNQVLRQQKAKLQMLRKHWSVLTIRRRMYYLASFVLFVPAIRVLQRRAVAVEIMRYSSSKARG
jgi:mycofactocin glycosyltransferase